MKIQAPPALCQYLYRNTIDNIPAKENFFHWHNVKRNLCQYGGISM